MTRLSIVIPCVQESGSFEATLASVLQNRPEDCEVLVVQPRCYDDPYDLQDEVRFVEAPAGSSLVDLLNVGLEQSSGEIVQLLSCDVEVLDGWTLDALSRFQDPTVGSVSPLIVRKEALEQVVSRGVRYGAGGSRRLCRGHSARNLIVIAPTLAAGMYRRQAVLDVGGFAPVVGDGLADVDLGLALRAAGYRCLHEDQALITSEQATEHAHLSLASGRAAERLFWRHHDQGSWLALGVAHPLTWLNEFIWNWHRPRLVLQWIGRMQGCLEKTPERPSAEDHQILALNVPERAPGSAASDAGPDVGGDRRRDSRAAA